MLLFLHTPLITGTSSVMTTAAVRLLRAVVLAVVLLGSSALRPSKAALNRAVSRYDASLDAVSDATLKPLIVAANNSQVPSQWRTKLASIATPSKPTSTKPTIRAPQPRPRRTRWRRTFAERIDDEADAGLAPAEVKMAPMSGAFADLLAEEERQKNVDTDPIDAPRRGAEWLVRKYAELFERGIK